MNAAEQAAGAAGSAGVGGLIGGMVVRQAGMTAAGMVGGGAGVGAAAGPVGIVVGALAGLAVYGLYRVGRDVVEENSYIITYDWCESCGHDHYAHIHWCTGVVWVDGKPKPCPCTDKGERLI